MTVLGSVQGMEVHGGMAQQRADVTGYVREKESMDTTKGKGMERGVEGNGRTPQRLRVRRNTNTTW